jgi:hypothetical protein
MATTIVNHKFHRWLNEAALFERDWRIANNLNFDFYDGEQWTEDEKTVIGERGQLPAVLNVIRPTVDMVMSLEADRRIDFQIAPREPSDDLMARLLTELLKQVYDLNDFDYFLSRAFCEAVIGGRGAIGCSVKMDKAGQEQVTIDWIPWEQVYVDPFHRRQDASDARYIIRRVWMDRDQVKDRYPEVESQLATTFVDDDYKGIEDAAQANGTDRGLQYYDWKSQRIALNEVWYKDAKGKVRHVIFSDVVFFEGSPDDDAKNESPYLNNFFPIIPIYSFRTHKGVPRGLVSYLLDYQRMINKANSKYLWNISSNRAMIEDGAVADPEEFRSEWNRPDGVVMLLAGGMQKVKAEDNLRECQYLASHLQFLLAMMQRTSGINDSMIGVGGINERSAQQQTVRITQGASMQTQLFDNLFFARKQLARVTLLLVGEKYTDRRVIRQTEPDGQNVYMELNQETGEKDPTTGKPIFANQINDILKYDVIVRPVKPFDTVRQNTMSMFSEVAKTGAIPGEIVGEAMLEMSELPNKQDLIKRMRTLFDMQAQQAAQQQAAEQAAQAAKAAGNSAGTPAGV